MSDYGEIIVFIIFILISIFSSISNKKKKTAENAKKENLAVKQPIVKKEVKSQQRIEKNLFEVFSEKVENKFSEVDEYFKNLESELNKREPQKIEVPKPRIQEFKAPLQKAEVTKTPISKKNKKICKNQNTNVSDIKRKLGNPKTIKEFMVVNEILNKPKALQ